MNNDPIVFELPIAKDKPHSYRAKEKDSSCPFCNPESLTDIYEQQGEMIWLHNKFPTLRDTKQTVLIESSDHLGDISTYSSAYNRKLMRFSRHCFEEMLHNLHNPQYESVVWYKNFGPRSGGSLVHPHMQIVGFKNLNAYKYIHQNNFSGFTVFAKKGLEVNIARHPIQGYIEFNVNLLAESGIDLWSDWIQTAAQFILQKLFNGRVDSYNLFFYPREDGGLCAKLINRFEAPPYFVGYKLSQVDDEETLKSVRDRLIDFAQNKKASI